MKKFLTKIMPIILVMFCFSFTVFATTMYAPDGRVIEVPYYEVQEWVNVGWSTGVTLYAPDGRIISVSPYEVQKWLDVGWYAFPVVIMYSEDGRSIIVAKQEVEAYKAVGWSTAVILYAPDGRTISVPPYEVQAWINVGWYTTPVYYQPEYTVSYTPSVIESKIDGTFNGWDGETIFKLTNGQIWQQAKYSYYYDYAYRPDVKIYKSGSQYKMAVEGARKEVVVKRIK